jgi:DNA-binding MarR family transcriptional regulator
MHFDDTCRTDEWSKSLLYSIRQILFLVQKHLDQRLTSGQHLSFSQYMILVGCSCGDRPHEGRIAKTQSRIAAALSVTEATVSRHIVSLKKAGLLASRINPQNRREKTLVLTEKGLEAFRSAKQLVDSELASIFSSIGPAERAPMLAQFESVLKRLLAKDRA